MLNTSFRKLRVFPATILATLFLLSSFANAQPKAEVLNQWKAEDARLARLAGLGRLWGAVKFFHPYLAYREIDWDKALIETMPKVNAAKTPQEYESAVNQMLAVLKDKSTRTEIESKTAPNVRTAGTTDEKLIKRQWCSRY